LYQESAQEFIVWSDVYAVESERERERENEREREKELAGLRLFVSLSRSFCHPPFLFISLSFSLLFLSIGLDMTYAYV